MRHGPLIPGLREFDAPRRRRRAWVGWLVLVLGLGIAVTVLAGVLGGVGPLRRLGVTETALEPVAWRPTADAGHVQVAVAIPETGLCSGDSVSVTALEAGDRISVQATRSAPTRREVCAGLGIAGDRTWVDVILDGPVGGRTVVRQADRAPLPQEPADPSVTR
ncbi:MAG: hypothetical protein EPO13_04095 [Actinomycetota bacterium]|nr:MAG: hypothetical protein EPO13_04095 [Actinomycetota bacterium]